MATVKNRGKILDAVLEMHGVGLVAVATPSTAVDLGGGALQRNTQIYTEGKLIIDVTAVSTFASEDEFEIMLQGSHDSTFTTWDTLFALHLGWAYDINLDRMGGDTTLFAGRSSRATFPGPTGLPVRFTLPFCNDFGGTVYRWLRVLSMMTTPTTGINYYAFLSI